MDTSTPTKFTSLCRDPFSWEFEFGRTHSTLENVHKCTRRNLDTIMETCPDVPDVISRVYTQLPQVAKERLWHSPTIAELGRALTDLSNQDTFSTFLGQLVSFVAVEAYQSNDSLNVPSEPMWSSTSDYATPVTQYRPLMTSLGATIDYNGYYHNLGIDTLSGYSHDEALAIKARLDSALTIIERVSPEALSLIRLFTVNIQLRKDPTLNHFTTWSNQLGIGKICASNIDEATPMNRLLDLLIHETMHSFLHAIEFQYGEFLVSRAASESWYGTKCVRSPWSGNLVELGSYTHAVVVWYGLWNFWRLAVDRLDQISHLIDEDEVVGSFAESERGFVNNTDVFGPTDEKYEYLHPEYLKFAGSYQTAIQKFSTIE